MHIPWTEVQAVAPKIAVAGDGNCFAAPLAVVDRTDVDVEVPAWCCGNVGDASAVRRKRRVGVDLVVVGQCVHLAGVDIENLKLDRGCVGIGGVDDPTAVG